MQILTREAAPDAIAPKRTTAVLRELKGHNLLAPPATDGAPATVTTAVDKALLNSNAAADELILLQLAG